MRDDLALIMISAYAIAFLIGGYVWKKARNHRKHHNTGDIVVYRGDDHSHDLSEPKKEDHPVEANAR
ncbi:MAG TPA: hypothetical protein VGR55_07295 [Candidatus Acidoferrum sp.]|nr:hypothetical protein [Candidatus Acidoferrum sp.]